MSLHCAVDDAETNTLLGRSPGAEGNPAPASKYAECLAEESIRIRKMRHSEVADHSIEAGCREGECASVTLAKLDAWVVLPSERKLRRREVDPYRYSAALGCGRCGIPPACSDVQDPRSMLDPDAIKERADHLLGHGGEMVVVPGRELLR
jgi:hypothetical protein